MKLVPITAEVLQANLGQALAISELMLSATEGAYDDQLNDCGAEVERLFILLDKLRGV